jgi:hypothetical protein
MKIEKVSYQKLYPIGNFLNERIGFEASVEDYENGSIESILRQLKEMADKCHREMNPPQEQSDESIHSSQIENLDQPKPPQEIQIGNIEAGIRSCKNIKILETYRLIIKKDAGLQKAYDEMMEKLKPKE